MIRSLGESIPPMPPRLRRFADAVHPKVSRSSLTSPSSSSAFHRVKTHFTDFPSALPVWGVIWLIQAIVFFALGIIVGLVAFKVPSSLFSTYPLPLNILYNHSNQKHNRNPNPNTSFRFRAPLAHCPFPLICSLCPWHLDRLR